VSDVYEPVENDDYAAFSVAFAAGGGGLEVSRVAAGHANSLMFEVFCENGSATFQRRPSEIGLFLRDNPGRDGFRQNDAFAYQARAFLEESPACPRTSLCRAARRSTKGSTTWRSSPRSPRRLLATELRSRSRSHSPSAHSSTPTSNPH